MCVVFVSMGTHRGQKTVGSPRARDTSGCKPSSVGAGTELRFSELG